MKNKKQNSEETQKQDKREEKNTKKIGNCSIPNLACETINSSCFIPLMKIMINHDTVNVQQLIILINVNYIITIIEHDYTLKIKLTTTSNGSS